MTNQTKPYDDYEKFPIRYANCWEDSKNLLRTAPKKSRILSICSGGDNTLALLLNNPREIVAFDTNIYQIYLAQLKVAALQNLNYEQVLVVLGIKSGDAWKEFQKLKTKLNSSAFDFFAQHPEYFQQGLIHTGKFEHYFQLFAQKVCPLFASQETLAKFASMSNIDEQEIFYNTKINNRRLKLLFRIFFGFRAMGKLGRDKNYYNHVSVHDKKTHAQDIKQRFDAGVSRIINQTNPYINYVLLNRFNENCLPTYLEPHNFAKLRQNLDKIKFIHGSLMDINGQFDYFNLSDIFEYMSQDDYCRNVAYLAKLSVPGAKVVYYNMQNPRLLDECSHDFQKLAAESEEGYLQNRAYFYRDFLVYQKIKAGKNE